MSDCAKTGWTDTCRWDSYWLILYGTSLGQVHKLHVHQGIQMFKTLKHIRKCFTLGSNLSLGIMHSIHLVAVFVSYKFWACLTPFIGTYTPLMIKPFPGLYKYPIRTENRFEPIWMIWFCSNFIFIFIFLCICWATILFLQKLIESIRLRF